MLKDGDKVKNQHGITGRVVETIWGCKEKSPFQVVDQFGNYHTDIAKDGSSQKSNVVWTPAAEDLDDALSA